MYFVVVYMFFIYFIYLKNSTQGGFNVQRLHNTRLVSSAVKVSSLSIIKNCCGVLAPAWDCFKYQTLFKDSAIQQDVQSLHLDLHHIIFNLPNSHRKFPFFHVHQALCWALTIHTINLMLPQTCRHLMTWALFWVKTRHIFLCPLIFFYISVRLTNISMTFNSVCMSEINRCIRYIQYISLLLTQTP